MKYAIHTLIIGLLIHFVLFNRLTYIIQIPPQVLTVLSLRKEVLIAAIMIQVIYVITRQQLWKRVVSDRLWMGGMIVLSVTLIIVACVSMMKGIAFSHLLLAFKYDFLGFLLGLVMYQVGVLLPKEQVSQIITSYIQWMKWLLILGLVWYSVIVIKPGILKLFGYDKFVYEGTIGSPPPAVYYSGYDHGVQRNQFLFERPISYGFRLVAFWPLFRAVVLRKHPLRETWFWWMMYGFNVLSTFSRAARLARVIQIILLGRIVYGKHFRQHFFKVMLPLLVIGGSVAYYGYSQGSRQFSNTGHITALIQGIQMRMTHPLTGLGAATAGPASHRAGHGFNPENQYLQILIEFGVIGFVGWILMYGYLHRLGIQRRWKHKTQLSNDDRIIVGLTVGLIGLSISGLFLHSFVDRMIVYPLMILIGIYRGKERNLTKKEPILRSSK